MGQIFEGHVPSCQNQKSFWDPSNQHPNTTVLGWVFFFKKTCFAGTPYWIYFFPLYTSSSETPAIKIPVINTRRHKYLHHTQTGKATLGHFLLKSTGLEYARIEWGGSHSVLATGGIQNLWVPSFCQDRMAAAPQNILGKIHEKVVEKNGKKTVKKDEKL